MCHVPDGPPSGTQQRGRGRSGNVAWGSGWGVCLWLGMQRLQRNPLLYRWDCVTDNPSEDSEVTLWLISDYHACHRQGSLCVCGEYDCFPFPLFFYWAKHQYVHFILGTLVRVFVWVIKMDWSLKSKHIFDDTTNPARGPTTIIKTSDGNDFVNKLWTLSICYLIRPIRWKKQLRAQVVTRAVPWRNYALQRCQFFFICRCLIFYETWNHSSLCCQVRGLSNVITCAVFVTCGPP